MLVTCLHYILRHSKGCSTNTFSKMADTNLSAILHKTDDLRLEEHPIPEPGVGEVQVCIHSVGICGTDVHVWKSGGFADFILRAPMLLGHESSGTVTKVGEGVTHLKIGDRVAMEPGVPCRRCDFCIAGRYNQCPDLICLATPPYHGVLTRFHVHDAAFTYKLPDNVSFEEGALLEPLSVAVHACKRAGVSLGHNVFICGAGTIGLVNLLTAKAMGAAQVVMTDISEDRLAIAKTLGATHTVHVNSNDVQEIAKRVEAALGAMPDITIECSGVESAIQTGIYATKSGGMLVLVGIGEKLATLPIVNAAVREVDIRGSMRYLNSYPVALAMVASGAINVKPLVTHHFALEETLAAFEVARTGAGGAVKVMIDCFRK